MWPLSHIGGIYNSIRYFLTGIVTICNEEDGAQRCEISGPFNINEGLRHGNALSLIFFNMVKMLHPLTFSEYGGQNSGAPLGSYGLGS